MDSEQEPQMSAREALDVAIASMVYRRTMRHADARNKRLNLKAKLEVKRDIARYDEAIRRVIAIRDLGMADEIQTGTVTVRVARRRTVTIGVPVPHDPATCGQCAEAEYR